jgi:hypothetical protein
VGGPASTVSGISITPQQTFANDVHMIGYAEATDRPAAREHRERRVVRPSTANDD